MNGCMDSLLLLPPLPPYVVQQSISSERREDDADRRFGSSRHAVRLRPRHEETEMRLSEENLLVISDDVKLRRDDDSHDKKRWMIGTEREKEKAHVLKDDVESTAASKRRKLKREYLPMEPGEYSPASATPALSISLSQTYDWRLKDQKGSTVQRPAHVEEMGLRINENNVVGKTTREWDDDKRPIAEPKRRHRK